MTGRSNRD